ncbi:MAG: universal stress protein [Bacteroidales bacterium]|nr:universal stress protein [Bacteroidales bacterium]
MKTKKVTKILIALDYFPTAQKVAEMGHELAKEMNAQIFLVHVISDIVYYSTVEYSPIMGFSGFLNLDPDETNGIKGMKKAGLDYLEKTKLHLADWTIKTIIKEGEVAPSILETAKDIHADIIVVGSHSRNWVKHILMGSVTEAVLHHTAIPLIIIPTKN